MVCSRRVTFRRLAVVLGLLLALSECVHADEPCLDPDAELGAAGRRKGVQKRDFLKRLRLGLAAGGGFFASDLVLRSFHFGRARGFYAGLNLRLRGSPSVTPFPFLLRRAARPR